LAALLFAKRERHNKMFCFHDLLYFFIHKKEEEGFMAESRKALIICLVERQIVNWKTAEINYIHL